jgi:type III pantothenate kinase
LPWFNGDLAHELPESFRGAKASWATKQIEHSLFYLPDASLQMCINYLLRMTNRLLLVNLNNTSTKIALSDKEGLLKKSVIPTNRLTTDAVNRVLRKWVFDYAVVGSVVPAKTGIFRKILRGRLVEVGAALDLGIGIDFPEPRSIGADRLANAVGVISRYGAPAVVVDFGTAVTFDIISHLRQYIGGVIAPGLGAMTEYLYQRTALLPRIDLSEPANIVGKSTKEAMLAGAIFGYRGLVRQIVTEIVGKLEGKAHIVATGSYASLIAAKLPELQIVDPDLTLEGLRIIALRNIPL